MKQHIQYCTTVDGAKIAFAVTGEGHPVVRTSHWLTHLEHDFTNPVWRHVMLGLAERHTLVRYDPRGEGMSQRDRTDIDFEAWMRDLEAVVDAANIPRFALFGCSQGAATAIAYAVRHPERVTHLILYGGFPIGAAKRGDPKRQEQLQLEKSLIRQGWGLEHEAHRQWFTSRFLPDGTAEQYRAYNHLQQVSCSAETAILHSDASGNIDVVDLLPKVKAPTLVLHCRDDVVVPFAAGQMLAAAIPGAKLVPLEGDNHMFLAGSPAHRVFFDAVSEFLGDPPPRHLPGTATFWETIEARGRAIDQNGVIKLVLLLLAIAGAVLSVVQLWPASRS